MKASASVLTSVAVAGFALTLTAHSQTTIPLTPKTKVVFKELIVDGNSYVVATVTVKETDPDTGADVYTTKEEKTIPAEGGGLEKIVTDVKMTVEETSPGTFTVTTQTDTFTTPVDESGTATGPVVEGPNNGTPTIEPGVTEENLNLPPTTTVEVSGEDIEEPPFVSEP